MAATGGDSASGRGELRRVLRGLVAAGEVMQIPDGRYQLETPGGGARGLVKLHRGRLCVGEVPLETGRRVRVRPGDVVETQTGQGADGAIARVLRVVEYSAEPLIGQLNGRGRYPYVESLSPHYKGRVSLVDPPAFGSDGDTVSVRIVDEDRRGLVGYVEALISDRRGAAHAAQTMLASHCVPTQWPSELLRAAEKLPKTVVPARHPDRRDLAGLPLVTIDGETARDFDDAVYAAKRRGGWRLVVAIADVAHYVKPKGALDLEALERGNSVYLPDRVVPMLPEAISNGLCSLKPREPRLAMVCDMQVSNAGNVTRFEFYEAVIRSWQRLTYKRVQEFLDCGALDVEPEVCRSLADLHGAFSALRSARDERGALDFDTHEATLELSGDHVAAIHPFIRSDAHRLIEEAMIAANVCAATYLEKQGVRALYRVHEGPSGERDERVRQAFAYAGIRLPRGRLDPAMLRGALDSLGERADRWVFEMLVLRSLTQAVYSPENKGHFGLALPRYMHFTSPIRRYADLVVHRAIKAALNGLPAPAPEDWLVACGEQVSMTERRADEVSWAVDGWLKCEYVSPRIGEVFPGVVMGVTDFGLFVELTGYYVQGLLHVSDLGSDYFQYQPATLALVGERSNRRFGLGDHLTVRLVDVQPALGRLDLELVEPSSGAGSPRKGRSRPATARDGTRGGARGGTRGRKRR